MARAGPGPVRNPRDFALGFDDQGREMLTYLPGETIGDRDPWPGWASADSMLAELLERSAIDVRALPDAFWVH